MYPDTANEQKKGKSKQEKTQVKADINVLLLEKANREFEQPDVVIYPGF